MTVFSDAKYRPLASRQGQPKMSKHDIVCLHTMVGNLTSTDAYFKKNGWSGTESHFGVGGKWGADKDKGLDGAIYQWQDTEYTADANLDGNHRVISIETADNAPSRASDIQPWTPKQLDSIVKITAWACKKYDIPAVLIPDTKPGRRGIGYHRQGCEHSLGVGAVPGFLVKGGERWSSSIGKECPGAQRIDQLRTVVIPRVKDILDGEEVLNSDDKKWISAEIRKAVVDVLTKEKIVPNKVLKAGDLQGDNWTVAGVLAASDQKADFANQDLKELLARP